MKPGEIPLTEALAHEHIRRQIIGAAMEVHRELGSGFLEKVYENALAVELARRGLRIERQKPVTVYYKAEVVGEYQADLIVENVVLVELKSVENMANVHYSQMANYLKATGMNVGLLINFGAPSLEWKRMVN